jgi:hypothetical protein
VQTDYVYETEAEFEADRDSIPVGATVIKLYEYLDNLAGFMVVPDYANTHSDNKFPAAASYPETDSSGTLRKLWTADRVGFVYFSAYANSTGIDIYWAVIINGIEQKLNGTNDYTAGKDHYIKTDLYPVSVGDVVEFAIGSYNATIRVPYSDQPMRCTFIPPKFIKKELPVVEKNGSYSLEEVRTAETWIDGKPIYRKTIYFPALSNMSEVTQDVSGLNAELFVEMKGFHYGSGSINPIPYVDTELTGMTAILYRVSTKVIVIKNSGIDLSGRAAYVTLTYTKTTD